MNQRDQTNKQPLELILLGTGTCVPDENRNASGYAIRYKDQTFLLDIGYGTLRRMIEAKVDYRAIDCICITHFHPDHTADLIPFLFATRHTPGFSRSKELSLIGPKGLKEFLGKQADIYGSWSKEPDFPLQIQEMSQDRFRAGSLSIYSAPMNHTDQSIGYRIETDDGRSVTYSGDTGFTPNLIELAHRTSLLLIECSFPSTMKMALHLTPDEVGKIAQESECQKVVLTHLYPLFDKENPVDRVKMFYRGIVTEGQDLMCFELE